MTRFNATGYTAHFTPPDGQPIGNVLDVEAWHPETGDALVVDPQRGNLRAANTFRNYSHLEETDVIIGTLPGSGWRLAWKQAGDEPPVVEPVPGWLITRGGFAHPITTNLDSGYGEALDPDEASLIEPDAGTDNPVRTNEGA